MVINGEVSHLWTERKYREMEKVNIFSDRTHNPPPYQKQSQQFTLKFLTPNRAHT